MDAWFATGSATFDPAPIVMLELEVNLVVRGTASYLLGDRRYALTPGTLTWLFPGQDHVLVDESSDHELWWAVFRPALVARLATTPHARPLLAGRSRRAVLAPAGLAAGSAVSAHSSAMCRTRRRSDDLLVNTGLGVPAELRLASVPRQRRRRRRRRSASGGGDGRPHAASRPGRG